ncbi:hypothetical protein BH11BAC6_BH11BAC6_09540 [soil metagenome]
MNSLPSQILNVGRNATADLTNLRVTDKMRKFAL